MDQEFINTPRIELINRELSEIQNSPKPAHREVNKKWLELIGQYNSSLPSSEEIDQRWERLLNQWQIPRSSYKD